MREQQLVLVVMYDMAPEVGGVERARASGDALTSYNQLARGAGGTPRTTRWGDPRDEEEEDRVRYGFGTVDSRSLTSSSPPGGRGGSGRRMRGGEEVGDLEAAGEAGDLDNEL